MEGHEPRQKRKQHGEFAEVAVEHSDFADMYFCADLRCLTAPDRALCTQMRHDQTF